MATARPPFFYSSSSVSNILTPRAPSFDDAGDEADEKEEERQQLHLAELRREPRVEEGEVLPYEEWAESNLWCWGRSQDGQAGKCCEEGREGRKERRDGGRGAMMQGRTRVVCACVDIRV